MAAILPHVVIVAVIDDDYEFRYVGEAQRQGYGINFKGIRVSQIVAAIPHLGILLRDAYDKVRLAGTPYVVRGRVDHEPPDAKPLYHETVFLPLGADSKTVDHLLIVGVFVPDPFWDVPTDKMAIITEEFFASAAAPDVPAQR